MPRFTIVGCDARVDGMYDLDLDDKFDGNEIHLIKVVSGVRLGEIGEAIDAFDYDVIVALAKITLARHEKDVPVEALLALKAGGVRMEKTEKELADEKAEAEEEEALPPANAPIGATEKESEPNTSGSHFSNGSADLPASDLPVIGVPT